MLPSDRKDASTCEKKPTDQEIQKTKGCSIGDTETVQSIEIHEKWQARVRGDEECCDIATEQRQNVATAGQIFTGQTSTDTPASIDKG